MMNESEESAGPLSGIGKLVERIQQGDQSAETRFLEKIQMYLTDGRVKDALYTALGGEAHKLSLSLSELVEEIRQDTMRRCLERARRSPGGKSNDKEPIWSVGADGQSATLIRDSMLKTEAGAVVDRHLGHTKKGPRAKGLKTAPAKWDQQNAEEQDLASDEMSTLQQAETEAATLDGHDQSLDLESLFERLSQYDDRYVLIARGLMEGLTHEQLAGQIGVSERTVRTLITRMRAIAPFKEMLAV